MADRWFFVPVATEEKTDSEGNVVSTKRYPKYSDCGGISYSTGNVVDFGAEEWNGASYPFTGEERYVARFYGDLDALDAVSEETDAHTMKTLNMPESEFAAILNARFGQERTFGEWSEAFSGGNTSDTS